MQKKWLLSLIIFVHTFKKSFHDIMGRFFLLA